MKHHARQFELPVADAGFRLLTETTLDGERHAAATAQSERERAENDHHQAPLPLPPTNHWKLFH